MPRSQSRDVTIPGERCRLRLLDGLLDGGLSEVRFRAHNDTGPTRSDCRLSVLPTDSARRSCTLGEFEASFS